MNCLRVAIIVLLCSTVTRAQQPWQLTGRLQSGVEYDSNIYESPSRTVAASAARFLMQTRATQQSKHWRTILDYAGALLVYDGARDENKLLQDANAQVLWLPRGGVKFYARGQGQLKFYFNSPTDYGATSGALGALLPLAAPVVLDLGLETGQLDYARGDDFDFTFNGGFATLRYRCNPRLSSELGFAHRQVDYVRPSFLNSTSGLVVTKQQDAFNVLRVAANYNARVYVQARLEAQRNRSNREVFDYNRAQLHVLAGYPFASRWLVRTSLLLQRKRYLASGPPVSLPELDPEREQSNHVIIDLSRELSATTTLLLRWSRQNNESPVRSRFYRKTLLFAGLELRL